MEPALAAPAAAAPVSGRDGSNGSTGSLQPWLILVVDDDPDVYEATAFALMDVQIFGRPLQLQHARSAAQAQRLLAVPPEPALILLDVVMETADAGLRLVSHIRDHLQLLRPRIILRTGQPGHAPELDTVTRYDIVDYKAKSELTRHKLCIALTASLRAYEQLRRLDASRQALERIISATQWFLGDDMRDAFAEGVLTQIAGFVGVDPEGLVCARPHSDGLGRPEHYRVVAAAGAYRGLMHQTLVALPDAAMADALRQCLQQRSTVVGKHSLTLHFAGASPDEDFAAYLATDQPLREIDARLLAMFSSVLSRAARHAALSQAATRDALTGLLNRHALPTLMRRLERSHDDAAAAAVLLIDLDDFKRVNDTHGHSCGDSVLKQVAQDLLAGVRSGDLVARWGGEEFLVGLTGADHDAAMAVAEKLRSGLAAQVHAAPAAQTLRVTVSVGVACLRAGESLERALERADAALYTAKHQGRNCVVPG